MTTPAARRARGRRRRSPSLWWSALVTLALCGVMSWATYLLMAPAVDRESALLLAPIAGCLLGLGLDSFVRVALGAGRGRGSRKALIAAAQRQTPPADGETLIATGRVSTDLPLVAPLSGKACAAYAYRMFYVSLESDEQREIAVYWGEAARPITLDAGSIRYRLAGAPSLVSKATRFTGRTAWERAEQWVSATTFERPAGGLGLRSIAGAWQAYAAASVPGRHDFAAPDPGRDIKSLQFEEQLLPIGVTASALGRWSAEAQTLEPQQAGRVPVAIGGPEQIPTSAGVPHSSWAYLATATVLTALGGGIVVAAMGPARSLSRVREVVAALLARLG